MYLRCTSAQCSAESGHQGLRACLGRVRPCSATYAGRSEPPPRSETRRWIGADTTGVDRLLTSGNCPLVHCLHDLRGRQRAPAGDHRLRREVPSPLWLPVLPGYLIEDGPPRREAGLLRRIEWNVRVPALWATESETGEEGDDENEWDPEMPGQRRKAGRTVGVTAPTGPVRGFSAPVRGPSPLRTDA
jgi:hypothetical protein